MCSSKWDGVYEPVTEAKTPVYFVIGEVMNIMDQNRLKKRIRFYMSCMQSRV